MEDTWKSQAQNKEMSFSQVAIGLSIAIYLCLDAVYLMLFICSLEHNLVVAAVEYLLRGRAATATEIEYVKVLHAFTSIE